jgi:hypothetical protein
MADVGRQILTIKLNIMKETMPWKKFYRISKTAFNRTEIKRLDARNTVALSDFYYELSKDFSRSVSRDYIDGVCLCFGAFRSCKGAKPLLVLFYKYLCLQKSFRDRKSLLVQNNSEINN